MITYRRQQVQNPYVGLNAYHNHCSTNPNFVRGNKSLNFLNVNPCKYVNITPEMLL